MSLTLENNRQDEPFANCSMGYFLPMNLPLEDYFLYILFHIDCGPDLYNKQLYISFSIQKMKDPNRPSGGYSEGVFYANVHDAETRFVFYTVERRYFAGKSCLCCCLWTATLEVTWACDFS